MEQKKKIECILVLHPLYICQLYMLWNNDIFHVLIKVLKLDVW